MVQSLSLIHISQFGTLGKACDNCHDKFRKELK